MKLTLEEQETIIRYDRASDEATLYTASPREAERWRKQGYTVTPSGAHGWQSVAPKGAIKLRKLVHGQLAKRKVSEAFLASARRSKKPEAVVD